MSAHGDGDLYTNHPFIDKNLLMNYKTEETLPNVKSKSKDPKEAGDK